MTINRSLSRCSLFRSLLAVTLVESINATGSVHQFLLAGEKRVAGRTDFNVQIVFLGRTCLKAFSAGTADSDFVIFGVNSWFHYPLPLA